MFASAFSFRLSDSCRRWPQTLTLTKLFRWSEVLNFNYTSKQGGFECLNGAFTHDEHCKKKTRKLNFFAIVNIKLLTSLLNNFTFNCFQIWKFELRFEIHESIEVCRLEILSFHHFFFCFYSAVTQGTDEPKPHLE